MVQGRTAKRRGDELHHAITDEARRRFLAPGRREGDAGTLQGIAAAGRIVDETIPEIRTLQGRPGGGAGSARRRAAAAGQGGGSGETLSAVAAKSASLLHGQP